MLCSPPAPAPQLADLESLLSDAATEESLKLLAREERDAAAQGTVGSATVCLRCRRCCRCLLPAVLAARAAPCPCKCGARCQSAAVPAPPPAFPLLLTAAACSSTLVNPWLFIPPGHPAQVPALEQELLLALLPKSENDARGVVVEVRWRGRVASGWRRSRCWIPCWK